MVLDLVQTIWPYFTAAATALVMLSATGHAILYKEDSRAAVAWVGVIWLAPIVGSVVYVLLGINRIKRRASVLRGEDPPSYLLEAGEFLCPVESLPDHLPADCGHMASLARLVNGLTQRPLVRGNAFEPLYNGDAAYPIMLEAIEQAEHSVSLTTYIFANDKVGRQFAGALGRAVRRGVEVRVLIDAIGARYSFPQVIHRLRKAGVTAAKFMPTYLPWGTRYMNLRSHRKIMVVDGVIGFTGGMNIRKDNLVQEIPRHPVQDLHFRVRGPVVRELQEVFAEDWAYTTHERLTGSAWFPALEAHGKAVARGISDGPDEDFDKLSMTLLGALACARRSVCVATPYFLPDPPLTSALSVAAMRGVTVDILLPARNNLRLVQWAANAHLAPLLERNCRIWFTPPPFDHTKLVIVDGVWVLMGSANWDPRSLRLNFEFNVECYDPALAAQLAPLMETRRLRAQRVELDDLVNRPFPLRLRDGMARLLTPYL